MNVLAIGNSFAVDANTYLHQIAEAAGEQITVVTLYIGGCSLERHYRNMLSGKRAYELYFNGFGTGFFVTLEEALLNRRWDVVTMQQASKDSTDYESYQPYAEALQEYVAQCAPKAKLLIHQTWAYEQGSEKLHTLMGYERAEQMQCDIVQAYEKCAKDLDADGIIPAGELFMSLLDNGIEKVHRDTFHATKGLGRYALGLLWYRMLTGRSVADNSFRDFHEPVSEQEIEIAKRCVERFAPIF